MYNAKNKGKGVFEHKYSKTLFSFRNPKTILYCEEGKDVFNVVGDTPTVKGVFSFFQQGGISMSYVDEVIERVIKENPNEPEFHQAVKEVLDSLRPVVDANEKAFRRDALLERLVNPERQIKFRVPWIDDNSQVPAIETYAADVAKAATAKKSLGSALACTYETGVVRKLSALTDRIASKADELENAVLSLDKNENIGAQSVMIRDTVLNLMGELRVACDEAETITAKVYWPMPTYADLLFGVKYERR